jgi:DNA-binding MarR family transcriptional regulator
VPYSLVGKNVTIARLMHETSTSPSRRSRGRSPESVGDGPDEDCKRLLAAILEFSLLLRHEPKLRQEPSGLGLDRAMHERGLGPRHLAALLSVALYGPMTVTQLATRHHVTVKTASLIAVELADACLVERREDPTDRRRTIVAIAKGKERAVDAGLKRRAASLRRTLDRLGPAQREGLITGLEVLAEEMTRDREREQSPVSAGGRAGLPTRPSRVRAR